MIVLVWTPAVCAQVLQFVLEAVRAESFNPATLFLFGCYTIGMFVQGACTMQQFMWQDITGVAHLIKDCFAVLDAPV